jgi:signal transduction histidine kinase/ligand-binding sensor domain-containing protein/AraC-like DNA-binding protein
MFCWRLCLVTLLCIGTNLLFSQDLNIRFSHLSSEDGLPTNQVNDILRDSHGFLWIGSHSGLSRYDGSDFKHFTKIENDSTSLLNDQVYAVYEDPKQRLWVITAEGMCVYDPVLERFNRDITSIFNEFQIPFGTFQHVLVDTAGNFWMVHSQGLFKFDKIKHHTIRVDPLPGKKISHICEGHNGNLWVISSDGTFSRMDNNLQVVYTNDQLTSNHTNEKFRIMADHDGDVWIHSGNDNRGVYFFSSASRSIFHINTKSDKIRLNSDIVRDIESGDNNMIWVCTDHGGVNLINKKNWSVKYLTHDPVDKRSLSGNTAAFIYKDKEDIIWIGTHKQGLNYYHEDLNKFILYQSSALDSNSLPYNDVNTFAEDHTGNLWIGTNGGGLVYFDRKKNSFAQYLHNPKNPASLSSNVIVSLYVDRSNHLWVGTYFGGLDYFDGSKFVHFKHTGANANEISDNSIWDIDEDSDGHIWICTLLGGLNRYDPRTKRFFHYGEVQGVFSSYVTSVLPDIDGSIWVGTGYGVSVLAKNSTASSHFLKAKRKGSLSNNQITCIYKRDASEAIWIGTLEGLNLYDRKNKSFRHLKTIHGLPGNEIMGVVADNHNKIWITTSKGVSVLTPNNFDANSDTLVAKVATFDISDGLQGKQFNAGAILETSDGHLFFGGTNGFNELDPSQIKDDHRVPPVVFSRILIDNNEIKPGQAVNGSVVLTKSIADTREIVLSPGYHSFSVEVSILTLISNQKTRCRYKLMGFDKDWVEAESNNRGAHYTSIDAGTYELTVSVATNDGVWHDGVAKLVIKVLPPIWRSNIALFVYLAMVLLATFVARHFIQLRERMKYEREKEQEGKQRARQFDALKIKFITNVSHEFRTPLSLILTPIESLLKHEEPRVIVAKENLQLIHRNARRLLNLVNQLLDFRQLTVEEVKLNASEGEIVTFIKDTASSFADLAQRKNITFTIESKVNEVVTLFDPNKIERILFNLISNAFKFTQEGETVTVEISREEKGGRDVLRIDVKDTGIGIAAGHLDKIFDRFFQSELPSKMMNEGSGIGLSITREFVRLHGGEITVTSEIGKGSCFSVILPIHRKGVIAPASEDAAETSDQAEPLSDAANRNEKSVVLLVDDNEDFRFYLKDNLKSRYQIEVAGDGDEAWEKIISLSPDIIVSDIMMPLMDGIELCTRIRDDKRTSHIPVILLTARTSEEQRLAGLKIGADDYIVKPFNFEILQARISNLIALRAKFHKKFQQNLEIRASEINISSLDEILVGKAIKVVETNIGNADFSVEELSRELGLSRGHLYRKLLSLTGKSAVEFIRIIRLQRAAQLLEKSQLTVAEIAYEVGFNNPKYFTKYFKQHYQVRPSEYARTRKKEERADE